MQEAIAPELLELKNQVSHLEAELAALKRMLGLPDHLAEASDAPAELTVRGIRLQNDDGLSGGQLSMTEDGAVLELAAANGQVVFEASAVQGHGSIAVLNDQGEPAAGMKSTPGAGVVSVVNRQGEVQAALLAHRDDFEHGSVEIIQDSKRCAVLGMVPQGGSLLLNSVQEDHSMVAAVSHEGSVLAFHDNGELPRATLAVNADMTILRSRGPGKGASEASMIGMAEQSSIDLDNTAGHSAMRIMTSGGAGWLSLNDASGEPRATLCVVENAGSLELSNAANPRAVFAAANAEGGQLALNHGKRPPQIIASARESGGILSMFSPEGQVLAGVETTPEGGRILTAIPNGAVVAQLASGPDGGAVAVCGPDGKVRGAMWSSPEGSSCDLYGIDGTRRVGMKAQESGGHLGVMSDSGSPRVALGVAQDHGHIIISASGGDPAIVGSATDSGGRVVLCDAEGEERLTLPEEF